MYRIISILLGHNTIKIILGQIQLLLVSEMKKIYKIEMFEKSLWFQNLHLNHINTLIILAPPSHVLLRAK